MKLLKPGMFFLLLFGLMACDSDTDSDKKDDNGITRIDYMIGDGKSNILLEGSKYEPMEFTFLIGNTLYDGNDIEEVIEDRVDKLSSINGDIKNWFGASPPEDNIAVFATVTSSNTEIVSFENGKIIAKKPGKADLTFQLDDNNLLTNVFDAHNIEYTGIHGSYDFGEVVVCPYTDLTLEANGTIIDVHSPIEVVSLTNDLGQGQTSIYAYPAIDTSNLASYGLTPEDCPSDTSRLAGHVIHFFEIFEEDEIGSHSGINILGIDLPNFTYTQVSNISEPRITEAGYNGHIVIGIANPLTIMAYSTELNRDIPVTQHYLTHGLSSARQSLNIMDSNNPSCLPEIEDGMSAYCVNSSDETHTISLNTANLPTVTSEPLSISEGKSSFEVNSVSGSPGSSFIFNTSLLVNGEEFDTTSFMGADFMGSNHDLRIFVNYTSSTDSNPPSDDHLYVQIGNVITLNNPGTGFFTMANNPSSPFSIGDPIEKSIQGRWVQADTGEDHYLPAHSPISFTTLTENQITYQTPQNTTATLLRAGIDDVEVSGNLNIIEESPLQAQRAINFDNPIKKKNQNIQAQSLSGIANIDLILQNVNTGQTTSVSIEEDGTFNENVATGIYDVEGSVTDGEIAYAIDTQITVEHDAVNTGSLNLAKVGLYNFDISLSGCEYNYKCYAGNQYEFTITASNIGAIASSSIEATINDISDLEHVTQFDITSKPITGAAPGDFIQYKFTATFSQPQTDTIIEIPISLADADSRSWEDTLEIKLSRYPAINVNIKAFNDDLSASVRGYLMLEGRTPIRVNGQNNSIKVPHKPGASYELILANEVYNEETPYAVSVNSLVTNQEISNASGIINKNENTDDVVNGATELTLTEKNIAYISAGDVDYYLINIPTEL